MSRTDKDRPYWVRRNDPTLLRYTAHDHVRLGLPVYRTRNVKDANGDVVMHEVTYYTDEFRWNAAVREGIRDADPYPFGEHSIQKRPDLWRKVPHTVTVPKTERYLAYTYSDTCSEGVPLSNDKGYENHVILTCTPELVESWSSVNKKSERKQLEVEERSYSRGHLKRLLKEVNAHGVEDLDDFNDDETPNHKKPYRGWW